MLIPELILFKTIETFQKIIMEDYNSLPSNEKNKSMLFDLFKTDDNGDLMKLSKFDYYTQSISLLTRDIDNPRFLDINIGYNTTRLSLPTIHILLPSENKGRFDSLGLSEGNPETYYDNATESFIISKSKTFLSTYHLMITSDNSSEVLTIYYWLRAMFIIFNDHLVFKGLLNINFSGADIQVTQEYVPPTIFHRNLSISFDFESNIKTKLRQKLANSFNVAVCDDFAQDIIDYNNNL